MQGFCVQVGIAWGLGRLPDSQSVQDFGDIMVSEAVIDNGNLKHEQDMPVQSKWYLEGRQTAI